MYPRLKVYLDKDFEEDKMKRILVWLVVFMMFISCTSISFAASKEAVQAANDLNAIGLFNGVGLNADGTPNFDLDRSMTRAEAVTMLVRLLGKEDEAKNNKWSTPFTDVAEWAKPYVGYAYANKLTNGTGATTFSGTAKVSATQYLTFVLRALGYNSNVDFQWDKAWELTDKLGITAGEYYPNCKFERGDAVIVSASALLSAMKGRDSLLVDTLVESGAVIASSAEQFKNVAEFRGTKIETFGGYFIIDEKYYTSCNNTNYVNHQYKYYGGTIELGVQTGKHGIKRYYVTRSSLFNLISALTNNYRIEKDELSNPYISGVLVPKKSTKNSTVEVDGISVACSGYDAFMSGFVYPIYTSINTTDGLFVYKTDKATLSYYSSDIIQLDKDEVMEVNGVKIISQGGGREYICIDDLIKYLGISVCDYEILGPGNEVTGIVVK